MGEWGVCDTPTGTCGIRGEWDVEAPSPTVGDVHGGMGRP